MKKITNKKQHIAIVRRSYRPDGGAEKIIQRIIAALQQHYPAKISLISQSWQSDDNQESQHQLLQLKKRVCVLRARCVRLFVSDIQATLAQHHFDLIQSHERVAGCQLYRAGDGVHAKWLAIRKAHASNFKARLLAYSSFQKAMCQAEQDMFLHPALKRVICVSKRVKQEIIHHYPRIDADKLTVIYNGIDLQKYKPISAIQKQNLRDKYHYKQQDKIIVFVGSGFERKGLTELLKGLALSPEWQLIVIGKDKKQAQFETLCQHLGIAERVHFMGVQTAMYDWYGLADLLVHPAWYEPFGNVILEAMASGLGVICTEQCGIAELMTPENEGYILKQDHTQPDHNALEEQIAAYLKQCSHPKQLFELGQAARKTAESLPISGMIKQFIALYQDLLK